MLEMLAVELLWFSFSRVKLIVDWGSMRVEG
jgi:hypothetical protein